MSNASIKVSFSLGTDLNNPIEINFTYKHKNLGEKNYKVPCFVILLHN